VKTTNIYVAEPGTSLSNWPDDWSRVGSLSDSLQITFNYKAAEDVFKKLQEYDMRMTDADIFAEWVKESHRLPDPKDTKLMRQLHVSQMLFKWVGGHYKLVSIDFEDGSAYEHGKVYN
jgi:hypothetical protein